MKKSDVLGTPRNVQEQWRSFVDNLSGTLPRRHTDKRIRHEYKYLINRCDFERYRTACARTMELDEHAGKDGAYFINSLYLDTPWLKDYYDKDGGALVRKKMRIRNYGYDLDWANLEMKRKNDIWEYKEDVRLTKEQVFRISGGDFSPLLQIGTETAKQFYVILSEGLYRPSCIVEYDRVAFLLPFEEVRITFDLNVRYSQSNFDLFAPKVLTPLFPDGAVVMEIKYNEFLPSWAKRLMGEVRRTTESVSKYCFSKMSYL